MWGYVNHKNRILANKIFDMIVDKDIAKLFNNGSSLKEKDQEFLKMYVWPIARNNATIHASYYCNLFNTTSLPFPTQRIQTYCFTTCTSCCNSDRYKTKWKYECPVECRPSNHKDWIYC